MRIAGPAALSLVVGLSLLSGCSVLKAAIAPTEQPVAEACAVLDSRELAAAMKPIVKAMNGADTPKSASKTFDEFAKTFEASIEEVENPRVKTQAQLTSIAVRNLAAEFRTFKPTRQHRDSTKEDLDTVQKEAGKLADLCDWER